ncbi:MAG: hypothetical protein JO073_10695 [Actinobacteria bacterium]|nr:hypothetical protein [Actinomycetota bacterium]
MSYRAARLAALALVTVAAAAACVAARTVGHRSSLPEPAGGWRVAIAAAVPGSSGKDGCGVPFGGTLAGVRSADIPCGVKVYVRFGSRTVLTEVVDHAPPSPGVTFDLTPALACLLAVRGRAQVEWSFIG